jgi:hypothetical protein
MKKEKRSIILFYDILHMINALPAEEAGQVIKALIDYEMETIVHGWKKSSLAYIFGVGRNQLDRGRQLFDERYGDQDVK